jgi:predicted dehydrogenase
MVRGPFKVAVLGVGEMGARHARVIAASSSFELVGVYDACGRRAEEVARALGVARFSDEAEAIARADAVVLATPIAAHAPTAERALKAGRHVLVEKPICARAGDAERLVGLAARARRRLFVGHSERFNPVVWALARAVGPSEIESIELARFGPVRAPGGVLLHLGIHDIDLAMRLTRSHARVVGVRGNEDTAELVLALDSGAQACVRSARVAGKRCRTLRLVTKSSLFLGDLLELRLLCKNRATGAVQSIDVPGFEPLAMQARALAAALDAAGTLPPSIPRGDPSHLATGEDGARALALALHADRLLCASDETQAAGVEKL